jgi:hypothetical protein
MRLDPGRANRARRPAALPALISACVLIGGIAGACGSSSSTSSPPGTTREGSGSLPVPTPPPPRALARQLKPVSDQTAAQLRRAKIRWNEPETLHVNQEAEIDAVIGTRVAMAVLKREVTGLGRQKSRTISVSDLVSAALTGSDFKIDPSVAIQRVVPKSGTVVWKWSVEPKAVGTHTVVLLVSALITVRASGGGVTFTHVGDTVFRKQFEIRTEPASMGSRIVSTLGSNVSWLVPAAIALAALSLEVARRQRRAPAEDRPSPHPRKGRRSPRGRG